MELRRNLKRKALTDCTNTIPTTTTAIPRKPFSDHTNIPTTTTTTFVPPKKPLSSSLTKPPKHSLTKPPKSSLSIRNSDENSFTSCGSNNEENPRIRIPQPSSNPPIPTITTADSGNCESSEDAENPRIRTSDSGNCEPDDAENPRIRPQPSTPPRPTTITSANSDDVHCEDSGIGTVYTRRKTVKKTRDKGKAVMVSSSCPPAERTRRLEDQLDKENRDVNLPKSYSYTVACPKAKKKRRTSLPLPQDFIDKQKAYFAEIDAFELPEEVVSESELE